MTLRISDRANRRRHLRVTLLFLLNQCCGPPSRRSAEDLGRGPYVAVDGARINAYAILEGEGEGGTRSNKWRNGKV